MVRLPGGPGARAVNPAGLAVPFLPQQQFGGSDSTLTDRVTVTVDLALGVGTTSPNTFFRIVKLAWQIVPFEQLPESGAAPFLGIYADHFSGDELLHGVTDARLGGVSQCDILLTRTQKLLCVFEDIPADGTTEWTASVSGRMYVETTGS